MEGKKTSIACSELSMTTATSKLKTISSQINSISPDSSSIHSSLDTLKQFDLCEESLPRYSPMKKSAAAKLQTRNLGTSILFLEKERTTTTQPLPRRARRNTTQTPHLRVHQSNRSLQGRKGPGAGQQSIPRHKYCVKKEIKISNSKFVTFVWFEEADGVCVIIWIV